MNSHTCSAPIGLPVEMFDLGKHMAMSSALLRVLAREFDIKGKANDIVGGAYHKTLFNPHPDPYTHLVNFCLKINVTGSSHLQKALINNSRDTITTNLLVSIFGSALHEYHTKGKTADEKQFRPSPPVNERGPEPHDGNNIPKPASKSRKTVLHRKVDDLGKQISGINEALGQMSKYQSREDQPLQSRNSSDRKATRQDSLSFQHQKRELNVTNRRNNCREEEDINNTTKSDINSHPKTEETYKVSDESGSRRRRKKRVKVAPQTPLSAMSNVQTNVYSKYTSLLLSDFGGTLADMPHGEESYEQYDSDYFERNRSTLNPCSGSNRSPRK